MTIHQAMAQALSELGVSKEEAEQRMAFADRMAKNAPTSAPVISGKEREFIDALKSQWAYLDHHPGTAQAMLRAYNKKIAGNN